MRNRIRKVWDHDRMQPIRRWFWFSYSLGFGAFGTYWFVSVQDNAFWAWASGILFAMAFCHLLINQMRRDMDAYDKGLDTLLNVIDKYRQSNQKLDADVAWFIRNTPTEINDRYVDRLLDRQQASVRAEKDDTEKSSAGSGAQRPS